jgi:hypothetical protein
MTSEPGSFARFTIAERKPQIIEQVAAGNDYPPAILAALETLRAELAGEPLRPPAEPAADASFWNAEAERYMGRTWLELPWYFAETFFYRRLLEAVRYLQPGPWQGRDPFAPQKREQEGQATAEWAEIEGQIEALGPERRFEALLYSSLWGNRADLSNRTVREKAVAGLAARNERHNLLIDDTARAAEALSSRPGRVDFVTDNTGRELLFDLALADFLLAHGWTRQIVMHLKDRPFFVSDAMRRDLEALLLRLGDRSLARRLAAHVAAGRLALRDEPFWTTFLMFRQMPPALAADLADAGLVILKGDVNYRRLLDDAHWPPSARVEEIAAYFPARLLVLRTLKAEIVAGLAPGQAEAIAAQDPDWLIDGKRGLVQLVDPPEV